MIVKKNNKYQVLSKKGKPLSKLLSKKQALKRLRQIEVFKKK